MTKLELFLGYRSLTDVRDASDELIEWYMNQYGFDRETSLRRLEAHARWNRRQVYRRKPVKVRKDNRTAHIHGLNKGHGWCESGPSKNVCWNCLHVFSGPLRTYPAPGAPGKCPHCQQFTLRIMSDRVRVPSVKRKNKVKNFKKLFAK
jgi:hypothetical protein